MGANTSSQIIGNGGNNGGNGNADNNSDSKSSTSFDSIINNNNNNNFNDNISSSSSSQTIHHQNHHHGLFVTNHHNDNNSGGSSGPIISLTSMFKDQKNFKKFTQKIKTKLKKSSNYSQQFQEMANQLSTEDLIQIYEEYRGLFFMKELSLHAARARPIASTIRNDLSELYDLKLNTDITLIYKGVDFPIHKAIVCVRCPYFRELLNKKEINSKVPVNLEINGLRVELFNDLLKYLYSGELSGSYDPRSNSASYEALIRISQQCGVPNPLRYDLKYLLETGIFSDASLCFQSINMTTNNNNNNDHQQFDSVTSTSGNTINKSSTSSSMCNCFEQNEYSCHQAILSARSPFFRNVILRQQKRNNNNSSNNSSQRMKIILDETIIPRRMVKILLHVMYRDSENLLDLIKSTIQCKCRINNSNNQDHHHNQKDNQINLVKEIMDLYEIGRFLEIDFLVQYCEDLLINLMNLETFLLILKWSEQPHGSPWVKRQSLTYLKEEFSTIISTPTILFQLDFGHLLEALKSDFLESNELCILKALIKWGENFLQKTMEDREPNLLLSHSLTRKSLRKKEIDDKKLFELIQDLLQFIRIGHILPIDSEFLLNICKRGLIELPRFMLDSSSTSSSQDSCQYKAWLRTINNSINNQYFQKPRFFTPYFEECKSILEERLDRQLSLEEDNLEFYFLNKKSTNNNFNNQQQQKQLNILPDNLYMIEKLNLKTTTNDESLISQDDQDDVDLESIININVNNVNNSFQHQICLTSTSSSSSAICYEEFNPQHQQPQQQKFSRLTNLPVLDEKMLYLMKQREQELRLSPFCIRALKISYNRCEALKLIQLRVVREFGLPDIASEVLHLKHFVLQQPQTKPKPNQSTLLPHKRFNSNNNQEEEDDDIDIDQKDCDRILMPPPPPRPTTFLNNSSNSNLSTNINCDPFSYDSEMKLEEHLSAQYELETQFSSTESHRTLSDYIPDIAFTAKEI